jgi:hypothetical protein
MMKKITTVALVTLLAGATPALSATVVVTPGATEGSTTDVLNGARVTATSPILEGFTAEDAFGSVTPGGPFPESQAGGHVIFGVNQAGFTNFIDFETTGVVTLSGITVFVSGDVPSNPESRSFFDLTLLGGTTADNLSLLGTTRVGGGANTVAFIFDAPTTLQFFRFEGTNLTNEGARVLEIDGVSPVPEPATWAMMLFGFGAVGYSMRSRKVGYKALQAI